MMCSRCVDDFPLLQIVGPTQPKARPLNISNPREQIDGHHVTCARQGLSSDPNMFWLINIKEIFAIRFITQLSLLTPTYPREEE